MTGGGTGGHIYPAIAIADKIREEEKESEILFVGKSGGMEEKVVPNHGYPIKFINVSGFNRKKIFSNIKVVLKLFKGFYQAYRIIKKYNPDVVIGTGGYVCGPVVRIAQFLGIKTYIHEQNAFPGVTNKLLERRTEKIFIGFPDAKKYFKSKSKIILTGNPVRKEFYNLDKIKCREELGIPEDAFVILATGGSGGAERINREVLKVIKELGKDSNTYIFFVTGRVYYSEIEKQVKISGYNALNNIEILEYIDRIEKYIGMSDLIIGRAGALTVAEITISGKASILIPSPNVTGNHQYYNGKSVAEKGGAILFEEKDMDSNENILIDQIKKLRDDPAEIRKMEIASRACGYENAAEIIYKEITK